MNGVRKGLLLAAIQLALVLSLGGKLLYDRFTRPRVWVLSQVYDPSCPSVAATSANNSSCLRKALPTQNRIRKILTPGIGTGSGPISKCTTISWSPNSRVPAPALGSTSAKIAMARLPPR